MDRVRSLGNFSLEDQSGNDSCDSSGSFEDENDFAGTSELSDSVAELKKQVSFLKTQIKYLKKIMVLSIFESKDDFKKFFHDIW